MAAKREGGLWIPVFSFDGGPWWTYKRRVGRPSGMSEGPASLSSWGPTKRPVMAEMPGAGCCVRMKALRLYCLLASFALLCTGLVKPLCGRASVAPSAHDM